MAPSSNNSFGWELLYNAVKNELNDKKNLGVVLIHFALLKSNFRCIGTGDKVFLFYYSLKLIINLSPIKCSKTKIPSNIN